MNIGKKINYSSEKNFGQDELRKLFESIEWESAAYPELVQRALQNSDTVFSARDGNTLVGIINGITDGAICVYCHYLAVHRDYQSVGIGSVLADMFLAHYWEIPTKVLIASASSLEFYQKKSFFVLNSGIAMYNSTIIRPD